MAVTPCTPTQTKYRPYKSNQQMSGTRSRSGGARPNSGGVRKGAGRPLGSRNKPVDLPKTDDPFKWLLALLQHPDTPLRLKLNAAKALLPYT